VARVIAELCQNHLGDRVLLKDMVWAAAGAGADYAKIQTIRVRELTHRERFEEGRHEHGVVQCIRRPYQPEYDRLSPLELSPDIERWFREECARAGLRALTSVFTRAAVRDVVAAGFGEVKVPSYDCASFPLLLDLRGRFSHVHVSTGATRDDEIAAAAQVLSGTSFSLLHCVTVYPTPLESMNLARIEWLRRFTPSVGFSDHSLVARDGIKASLCALALGADVIERHFTVLPADRTKDGPVSITPDRLAELCRWAKAPRDDLARYVQEAIPEREAMTGVATRELSNEELLNRDYYRGRFASRVGGRWIYNWEDEAIP